MKLIDIIKAVVWVGNRLRKRRVLLCVEDDDADAMMLRDELITSGCKLEIVRSAEEALVVMRHTRFKAALTDIGLPGMDGDALARRIRDDYPKTRIFFTTGNSFVSIEPSELICVIRKPVTAANIRRMMI